MAHSPDTSQPQCAPTASETHWSPRGSPLHASNAVEHWPAMQHALLHGEVSEHDVVQVCVDTSQAWPK
jgi:hypothetical protein